MKTVAIKSIVLAGLLSVAGAGYAMQGDRHEHNCGEHRLQMMTKVLELSDAQQADIKALMEARKTDSEADRKQLGDLKKTLRTAPFDESTARTTADKIGELTARLAYQRASHRAAVGALLTDEQKSKLEAMSKMRGEKRGKKRGSCKGKGGHHKQHAQ